MIESLNLPGPELRSAIQRRKSLVVWLVILSCLFVASVAIIWNSFVEDSYWWILGTALMVLSGVSMIICTLFFLEVRREIFESDIGQNFWHQPKWKNLEQKRFVLAWFEVFLYVLAAYFLICPLALLYMEPDSRLLGMRQTSSFDIELFGIMEMGIMACIGVTIISVVLGMTLVTSYRYKISREMEKFEEEHLAKRKAGY